MKNTTRTNLQDKMILRWNNPAKILDLFLDYFHHDLFFEIDEQPLIELQPRIYWERFFQMQPVQITIDVQVPVQTKTGYHHGFIDLLARITLPGPYVFYIKNKNKKIKTLDFLILLRSGISNYTKQLGTIKLFWKSFPSAIPFLITHQPVLDKWKNLYRGQGVFLVFENLDIQISKFCDSDSWS